MPNAAVLILKRFAAFQAPAFGAVRQAIAGVFGTCRNRRFIRCR